MLSDEPDLFVVGDPNQSVYGFNGADPTLLDRLPEILRGHQRSSGSTRTIAAHPRSWRSRPRCCARAAAFGGRRGGAATHDPGRRSGAPGRVARHRRRRGDLGGRPGQDVARPGRPLVDHRRAHPHQRTADQGAGRHGGGRVPEPWSPARTSGRPATCAATGRREAPAGGRGVDLDDDEVAESRRPRPRRAHARSTGPRACSGRRCSSSGSSAGLMPHRLGPDARCDRRGAPPALCRPDPLRGRALVQLVRAVSGERRGSERGPARGGPEPVAGADRAERSPSSRRRPRADRGVRGLDGRVAELPTARLGRGRAAATTRPVRPGKVGPPDRPRWGWPSHVGSPGAAAQGGRRAQRPRRRRRPRRLHPRRDAGTTCQSCRWPSCCRDRPARSSEVLRLAKRARRARDRPGQRDRSVRRRRARSPTASCWPSTG